MDPEVGSAPATTPDATAPDAASLSPAIAPGAPGPAFELPTAREVVGRGLQLALDANRDIRNVSLYVGLLVLAVAGPAALLLVVDLPRLFEVNWQLPQVVTPEEAATLLNLIGPLYVVGALALLGVVSVSLDGQLMAASVLGARAVGRPMSLRESLRRARQVFWRYGFAAFAVGILSTVISTLVGLAIGSLGHAESVGGSLVGSLIATLLLAPCGYILTSIVIGDVDGGAALGRSITLARARPRLALVVAAFAFLASTFQVLGLGVALDLVDRVVAFLHPDLGGGAGLLVAIPAIAIALVAFGSLGLTVGAVTAAPQVTAFLGLTRYSAGLDRARTSGPVDAAPAAPPPTDPTAPTAPTGEVPPVEPSAGSVTPPAAPASYWVQPGPTTRARTRWVTLPMLALIALEALAVAAGISAALQR